MSDHVLLVDDDDSIRDMAGTALRYAGFEVSVAADGRTALDVVSRDEPDLVVLDVLMPGLDGFEVCRRMRAAGSKTPVIFLTAKATSRDVLDGFGRGADDYLTKPFVLDELVARIKAVLHRSRPATPDGPLRCGELELDVGRHEVRLGARLIELSPTEFKLLRYLMTNTGRVVSKQQILERVWCDDPDRDAHVVETYISALRRHLHTEGRDSLIRTVRLVGYTLHVPDG